MSQFKKKLRAIFDKGAMMDGSTQVDPNTRYVPRNNGKGQFNWDVYDRKEDRFLSDAEVKRIPIERLEHEALTGGMN